MQAVLEKFQKELKSLRDLISIFNLENTVAKENIENIPIIQEYIISFQKLATVKRRYNYNSVIISLYGYFEKFIEEVLATYIEKINCFFPKYEDLPETIKKYHYRLSLALLDKVDSNRYNGSLRKEHIVKNLHSCLNFDTEYKLNKEAFSKHAANFRKEIVEECFGKAGIANISDLILKEMDFKSYIIKNFENLDNEFNISRDFFYYLDDLAERRNDVAHGVPSEILGNEILIDYILFFEYYSKAIVSAVNKTIWRFEVQLRGKDFGVLTDVFKNGTVICIYSNHNSIKIGDYIIAFSDNSIVKSRILNIQLNGKNVSSVNNENSYEVGLLLDNNIKKHYTIKLLN